MTERTGPWADETAEMPPRPGGYRRGVAPVNRSGQRRTDPAARPADHGWHDVAQRQPRLPLGYRMRQLRRGSRLTFTAMVFALVCWGIWAVSSWGNLGSPLVTLVLTSLVAVGLFALVRLLGRVIWERQLGRTRRSARGAHLATALFLAAVGVAFLRQTEWFVTVWNWVAG
jgi:hypothetical protein